MHCGHSATESKSNHLHLNDRFPGEPGIAGLLLVFSATCSRRGSLEVSGMGILQFGCRSVTQPALSKQGRVSETN